MSDQTQGAGTQQEVAKPPYGRPIREIIDDLRKTIPNSMLKSRKQGGQDLTYLPWYNAVKMLDYYAPGWSYEVRSVTPIGGNQVVLTVRISIPCAEGIVYREATGIEEEEGVKFGDAASNSESMALRRAAAKFGLALSLYEKK